MINFIKNKSIKYKLILIIMSTCVIPVCVSSAVILSSGSYYIKEHVVSDLQVVVESVSGVNAGAFDGLSSSNMDMSLFRSDRSILDACAYDNQGRILSVYSASSSLLVNCLEYKSEKAQIMDDSLISFHNISLNGRKVGNVYIRSDLRKIDGYINNRAAVILIVIMLTIFISYAVALRLQVVIGEPIVNLMKDVTSISSGGGYSVRLRKFCDGELGHIVDSFNKILEKREVQNNQFFKKSKELKALFYQSDKAIEYFDKEFRNPFHAVNSFKNMLQNQVFGPVNPMYVKYFKDVCRLDSELYYLVHKILKLQKIQALVPDDKVGELLFSEAFEKAVKKHRKMIIRYGVNVRTDIVNFRVKESFSQVFELVLDHIISVFVMGKKVKENYSIDLKVSLNTLAGEPVLEVVAAFEDLNAKKNYVNDNMRNLELGQLIDAIKNSEEIIEPSDEGVIDFGSMEVLGKVNVINFLTLINNGEANVAIYPDKVILTMYFSLGNITANYVDEVGVREVS